MEPQSANDVASRLPEAESLPDGFTEGDSSATVCIPCQQLLPQSAALPDGFSEVSDSDSQSTKDGADPSPLFSQLGLDSPASPQGQTVDDVAVSREMNTFTVDLRAEKTRRFPVQLSESSSVDTNTVNNEHFRSTLINQNERVSEATKTRKRRMKEIKTLLDAPDKATEEKLQLLHTKYLQQVAEMETMEKELTITRHKHLQESNERVALAADLNKSVLLRQKLESLCRELQRQNKILLEEGKKIAAEEQQRRQELSTKFHNTIKEISLKLDEQGDDRIKQAKENEMLREKLKHFTQQYEIREEHFSHQLRTKALEQQLLEVKLKQQQELFIQEEAKARTLTEQISKLILTEQDLRSQLALYGDKFEQFQDTLTKSNEVFASFKQEMEKMSKTIKTLEKENLSLKNKCQKSDISLIELLDERASLKKQLETTSNQRKKLEALCRALQAERKQQAHTPEPASPETSQEESTAGT